MNYQFLDDWLTCVCV